MQIRNSITMLLINPELYSFIVQHFQYQKNIVKYSQNTMLSFLFKLYCYANIVQTTKLEMSCQMPVLVLLDTPFSIHLFYVLLLCIFHIIYCTFSKQMLTISKFPPQHRARCYCQSKIGCYHTSKCDEGDGTAARDGSQSVPRNFFIKKPLTTPENLIKPTPKYTFKAHASDCHRATSKINSNKGNALIYHKRKPMLPSSLPSKTIPNTNQRIDYENSILHAKPFSIFERTLSSRRWQQPNRNEDNLARIHNWAAAQTDANVKGINQYRNEHPNECVSILNTSLPLRHHPSSHTCQVRYKLNERNQPVPIMTTENGYGICSICSKSLEPCTTDNFMKPLQNNGNSSNSSSIIIIPNDSMESSSTILEINNYGESKNLVLKNKTRNLVDIKIINKQWPVNSLALKYQRKY